jgi:hypothetical protein
MRTAPYFNNHRFHKNICLIISVTSSSCPTCPVLNHVILKSGRAPRSLGGRPTEKRCAAFHRQRLGLKNPAAGDTGLPEPLQGLPDDSIEIARTVVGTGFLPESRKEATQQVRGSPRRLWPPICFGLPRTASLHYGGSRAVTVFLFPKKIPLQGRSVSNRATPQSCTIKATSHYHNERSGPGSCSNATFRHHS